jgi:amino acid transporter
MLSWVVATVFCVLATTLVDGSVGAIFAVVLTIAITTLLLSYLIILPSAWALRRTQPDVVRPFRVPGGRTGLNVCTALVFLWVAFGSFAAVFPGVLERLFGIDYDFTGTWGCLPDNLRGLHHRNAGGGRGNRRRRISLATPPWSHRRRPRVRPGGSLSSPLSGLRLSWFKAVLRERLIEE